MRFLFVSDFLPDASSGAAGSLIAIGAVLERMGHTVAFEWHLDEPYRLPHPALQRAFELPRRQLRQVERRLARESADVVIVSQPYAYQVYERLAPRFPRTLFLNRTHGWEERVYEAQRRHGWHRTDPAGRAASALGQWLAHRACRRTARAAHGIIAACSRCAEFVRERHGLDGRRVACIPYGLEEAFRDLPDRTFEPPGQRLLFVGNLLPLKGARVLEAVLPAVAARHPRASLTFVVDPGSVLRAERLFRPAFGPRLALSPWLERQTLLNVYRRHDVLLFPSLFEGFGKVWTEAMSAGMLVVGFAEGGLPDLAAHRQEALFCEVGDVKAYRALLHAALDDPPASTAMGVRAQRMIRTHTWDRTAQATAAFCERRLAELAS